MLVSREEAVMLGLGWLGLMGYRGVDMMLVPREEVVMVLPSRFYEARLWGRRSLWGLFGEGLCFFGTLGNFVFCYVVGSLKYKKK